MTNIIQFPTLKRRQQVQMDRINALFNLPAAATLKIVIGK